ncbi:hypothetical protein [Microcoleus sp. bin38.metabat.b11b12b14.051]|nr:hypothetical protein [Microcoleus sp. bin38.metabat.b11b12b14.051]
MKGKSEILHFWRSHELRAGLIPGFCTDTSGLNLLIYPRNRVDEY